MLHCKGVLLVNGPHYFAHIVFVIPSSVRIMADRAYDLRFGRSDSKSSQPTFLSKSLCFQRGGLIYNRVDHFYPFKVLPNGFSVIMLYFTLDFLFCCL
jgi:hypothetical protein